MVKTIVIPQNNSYNLSIPNSYIGKKIEILFYALDEVSEEKSEKGSNVARFKGILTSDEAQQYDKYLKKARGEWDRDIK